MIKTKLKLPSCTCIINKSIAASVTVHNLHELYKRLGSMHSSSSSLRSLPSGKSRPPMDPHFSMLSFFLKFAASLGQDPVQEFLPWSSPSSFTLHSSFYYFSLKRVLSLYVPSCLCISAGKWVGLHDMAIVGREVLKDLHCITLCNSNRNQTFI